MEASYVDAHLPIVANLLKGNFTAAEPVDGNSGKYSSADHVYFISEYGYGASPENAPINSVAVIEFTNAVTKYDQECGGSGTNTKMDFLRRAEKNDNIQSIVFLIDSGGGEAYAGMDMARAIRTSTKPTIAFIDDFACSAAYEIASACDLVIANHKMARTGSVGTYLTIADYSEYFAMQGIKLIDIYADESEKDKNKAFREAIKGRTELMKQYVNAVNEEFLSSIEEHRSGKLTSGRETWGTGKVFFAEEAKAIGLIDDIMSWDDFLKFLTDK